MDFGAKMGIFLFGVRWYQKAVSIEKCKEYVGNVKPSGIGKLEKVDTAAVASRERNLCSVFLPKRQSSTSRNKMTIWNFVQEWQCNLYGKDVWGGLCVSNNNERPKHYHCCPSHCVAHKSHDIVKVSYE